MWQKENVWKWLLLFRCDKMHYKNRKQNRLHEKLFLLLIITWTLCCGWIIVIINPNRSDSTSPLKTFPNINIMLKNIIYTCFLYYQVYPINCPTTQSRIKPRITTHTNTQKETYTTHTHTHITIPLCFKNYTTRGQTHTHTHITIYIYTWMHFYKRQGNIIVNII